VIDLYLTMGFAVFVVALLVVSVIFEWKATFVVSALLAVLALVVVGTIITLGWNEYFAPEF
jgi:VIT1/CCC1 family predicted Fe2+/Mn2+ transporter